MTRRRQRRHRRFPRVIRMRLPVYDEIHTTIGLKAAETGGMFGGDPRTGTVTSYHFDENAQRSSTTYSPDVETVNRVLSERWNPQGIRLMGFPHSHPLWCARPSGGDARYAEAILKHNPDLPFLAVPIVQTKPDTGRFKMRMFLALRNRRSGVRFVRVRVVLFEDGSDDHDPQFPAAHKDRRMTKAARRFWPHLFAAHQIPAEFPCAF